MLFSEGIGVWSVTFDDWEEEEELLRVEASMDDEDDDEDGLDEVDVDVEIVDVDVDEEGWSLTTTSWCMPVFVLDEAVAVENPVPLDGQTNDAFSTFESKTKQKIN